MKASKSTKAQSLSEPVAPRLSRDDWLTTAFETVAESGFDSVRVLTLASTLGVTRGSFYWHFTDHAELIAALVERWRTREIEAHQRALNAPALEPKADLERLLEGALAHAGNEVKYLRFELALRGLGRRDPEVAKVLIEVDRMRMRLFEAKFLRLTGDEKSAGELAALFYLAIVGGTHALARPANPARTKDYLQSIISHYLIVQQGTATKPA
jgi:AcrR family transcriptional regulator